MELQLTQTDQGVALPAMIMVCQDCGYVVKPGESHKVCSMCGGRNMKLERDANRLVVLKCAS